MTASPLEYAPRPRGRRRRWWIWRISWMLLILGLSVAGHFRREIATHAGLLYAQHRAMNHTAPAELVVFASDPVQAKMLVNSSAGYVWGAFNAPPAVFPDPVWNDFRLRLTNSGSGPAGATVFCHEMRTPAGESRVVALNLFYTGPWSTVPIMFESMIVDPATLLAKPRRNSSSICGISHESMMMAMQRTQIFAGQLDPDDPSHFTIAYQIGDQPGMMDAQLRNDDQLVITVRSVPATRTLSENQMIAPR